MSSQDFCSYSHTVGCYVSVGNVDATDPLLGFTNPVDLAVSSDGMLYVLNRGRLKVLQRVTVMTKSEEHKGDFARSGTGDGKMMWPSSIALDRDDNVYISDEALQRISIFSKHGEFIGKWGTQGEGDGEFDRPAFIAFDNDDNLLVSDGLNNRIQRYTKDGRFLNSWGRKGAADGEFNMPWGIAVDRDGDVYVGDWRNDRVQKFDAEGKHLASWGVSGQGDGEFRRPAGVAVDDEGNVYVADWDNDRVQVLGPDGSFITKLRGESTLSKWAQDYVTYWENYTEQREAADLEPELDPLTYDDTFREESARIDNRLWGPTSVKLDDEGNIYVVDSCRYRVQVYRKEPQSLNVGETAAAPATA